MLTIASFRFYWYIGLLTLVPTTAAISQPLQDTTIQVTTIGFSIGGHSPAGDMADRFGNSAFLGMSVHRKTSSNWQFGIEGGFIFGNKVNQAVATGIRTEEGFIIDEAGNYVDLLVLERGMILQGSVGKVFPLFGPNPNSGLLLRLGAGMLQHSIRLEARNNVVPQIEGEYSKGYDRLSNGFMMHQFIGYQYLGNQRLVNFTLGFEGYQAFTESRRDFNFDMGAKDESSRIDHLYGVKLTWSIPIYKKQSSDFYYY